MRCPLPRIFLRFAAGQTRGMQKVVFTGHFFTEQIAASIIAQNNDFIYNYLCVKLYII